MESITGSKTYDVKSETINTSKTYAVTNEWILYSHTIESKDTCDTVAVPLGITVNNKGVTLKWVCNNYYNCTISHYYEDGLYYTEYKFKSSSSYTDLTCTMLHYSYTDTDGVKHDLGTANPGSTYLVTKSTKNYYYTDSDGLKHNLGENNPGSTYTVGSDLTYDVYSRDTTTQGTYDVESRDDSTEEGKYVYYGQVSVHDWVTDSEGVPHIELVDKWLTKIFDTDQGADYTYTEICDTYEDEVTLSYQGREKEVTTTTYYYVDDDGQEQEVGMTETIKEFDGDHSYETNTESTGEQGPTITIDKPITHYYYKDSDNVEHHLGTTDPGDTYTISEPVYYFIDAGDNAHDLGVLGSDTFYKTGSNYYFEDSDGIKHNLGNSLDSVIWDSYAYILGTNDLQKEKLADKGINPDYITDYIEGYMYAGKTTE